MFSGPLMSDDDNVVNFHIIDGEILLTLPQNFTIILYFS
jgi:uncharacterized ubiquitin-like protein YukD